MDRIIVGEGAYGCVHKPSLHCLKEPEPNFDYSNYVSKIMKNKNAENELKEFVTISKLDTKDAYHLGTPILCKPDFEKPNVKNDIKRCKHIKDDIEKNEDNYSLLVLKFGGPDLKSFCINYLSTFMAKDTVKKGDLFWLEIHHLLKGLKFFRENEIVHYDLKPQNILFNSKTKQMKFIDFGLMRTNKEIKNSSEKNNNMLGIFHWSYPFDCGFMNKTIFNKYKKLGSKERTQLKNEFITLIVKGSPIKTNFPLPISKPDAFKILFTYLDPTYMEPDAVTQYGYVDSFFDGLDKIVDKFNYKEYLDHTIKSIDIFGLGLTCQFCANHFYRHKYLSLSEFTVLNAFFKKMYDFNPLTRELDLDILISEYENIMLKNGVLLRLGKSFDKNGKLTNNHSTPLEIIKEQKIDEKSLPKPLSKELDKLADKDVVQIQKKNADCGEGKEFNLTTKRCVKRCKTGYLRNKKFRCVKKTRKTNSHNIHMNTNKNKKSMKKAISKSIQTI
jgi:serine/threonine protein kinase